MAKLDTQVISIPFAGGLDADSDKLGLDPPSLRAADDAVFDRAGGVQPREGSTVLSGLDRLELSIGRRRAMGTNRDELLMYAAGLVYGYSRLDSRWVPEGRMESCYVEEAAVAHSLSRKDQGTPDRAVAGNVALYAWTEGADILYQVVDLLTGTVFETVTISTASMPRCRAPDLNTLHLYYASGANLKVRVIDVAFYSTKLNGEGADFTLDSTLNTSKRFDVDTPASSAVTWVAFPTTTEGQYRVLRVNVAGTILTTATKARSVDQEIAISVDPGRVSLSVARVTGDANIIHDWLNATTLADELVSTTVKAGETTVLGLTVGCKTGTAYVFWGTDDNVDTQSARVTRGTVTTGGAVALKTLVRHSYIATRARVWVESATEIVLIGVARVSFPVSDPPATYLQLGYALISGESPVGTEGASGGSGAGDGLLLIARMSYGEGVIYTGNAGDFHQPDLQEIGHGVGRTKFACLLRYRHSMVTSDRFFLQASEIKLREHSFDFAQAKAYQQAEVGERTYIGGGALMAHSAGGVTVNNAGVPIGSIGSTAEAGFWSFPENIVAPTFADTGGKLDLKSYSWRFFWEWRNQRGEIEKSSFAGAITKTVTGGAGTAHKATFSTIPTLAWTMKDSVVLAVYRTEGNPVDGAPFYRCSSTDPADATYVKNDPSVDTVTWADTQYGDDAVAHLSALQKNEVDYISKGEVDDVPPPEAPRYVAAGQSRLFVVPARSRHTVYFSKIRFEGYCPAFNEDAQIAVPERGGRVVAVAPLEDSVIIFKESAVYVVPGRGPNNALVDGYGPPQPITEDVGCVEPLSVVRAPPGVFFLSRKGMAVVERNLGVRIIGADVYSLMDPDVFGADQAPRAAVAIPNQDRVVWFTPLYAMSYDYRHDRWSRFNNTQWTSHSAVHTAGLGVPARMAWIDRSGTDIQAENPGVYTDNGAAYGMVVQTAWIKLAGLQGFARARWWSVLGEYRSANTMQIQVAYDYSDTFIDSTVWTPPASSAGDPQQARGRFSRQQAEAVMFKITAGGTAGEHFRLTGVSIEVGVKKGVRRQPLAQSV